jgi:hypothetical protein
MPSNKKKTKNKRRTSKKAKATKKSLAANRSVEAKRSKKSPKKKAVKKTVPSGRSGAKRRKLVKAERESKQEIRRRTSTASAIVSGRQSGDLQGLSQAEQADSESVEELVEEGNVAEAGAVAGVEASENAEGKEVHTREFPEDDVPEEYLDKD